MGILDNIVSGIKGFMGNKGNIGAMTTVDPTQTPQPVQGGVTNTPIQTVLQKILKLIQTFSLPLCFYEL